MLRFCRGLFVCFSGSLQFWKGQEAVSYTVGLSVDRSGEKIINHYRPTVRSTVRRSRFPKNTARSALHGNCTALIGFCKDNHRRHPVPVESTNAEHQKTHNICIVFYSKQIKSYQIYSNHRIFSAVAEMSRLWKENRSRDERLRFTDGFCLHALKMATSACFHIFLLFIYHSLRIVYTKGQNNTANNVVYLVKIILLSYFLLILYLVHATTVWWNKDYQ